MFLRAFSAFVALPGTVAGLVPALLLAVDGARGEGHASGRGLAGVGLAALVWCAADFLRSGGGTLAPWDPPRRLVITGLYRFVRNPMYLAVLAVVAGWGLAAGARLLLWYAAALWAGFHLRVVLHEEPAQRRRFGAEWEAYRGSVSRWWPKPAPAARSGR